MPLIDDIHAARKKIETFSMPFTHGINKGNGNQTIISAAGVAKTRLKSFDSHLIDLQTWAEKHEQVDNISELTPPLKINPQVAVSEFDKAAASISGYTAKKDHHRTISTERIITIGRALTTLRLDSLPQQKKEATLAIALYLHDAIKETGESINALYVEADKLVINHRQLKTPRGGTRTNLVDLDHDTYGTGHLSSHAIAAAAALAIGSIVIFFACNTKPKNTANTSQPAPVATSIDQPKLSVNILPLDLSLERN